MVFFVAKHPEYTTHFQYLIIIKTQIVVLLLVILNGDQYLVCIFLLYLLNNYAFNWISFSLLIDCIIVNCCEWIRINQSIIIQRKHENFYIDVWLFDRCSACRFVNAAVVIFWCFTHFFLRDDDIDDDTSQQGEDKLPPPSQPAISLHNPYLDVRIQKTIRVHLEHAKHLHVELGRCSFPSYLSTFVSVLLCRIDLPCRFLILVKQQNIRVVT